MSDTIPQPDAIQLLTADHAEVGAKFAQIESLPDGDARGERHHVEEEETELFPKLQASIRRSDLREMGSKLAAAKRMAPTHPHPSSRNTPPGNVVAGTATAMMDKARDALRRD